MWKWIVGGGAAVLVLIYGTMFNGLVGKDENVKQSYAQVQNAMQRQADLLPNLVETVKGYAGHENKTLTAVIEARSQVSAVAKMDPAKISNDPAMQRQLIEAQQNMGKALLSLNAVREAYPELKTAPLFVSLMADIAGSQNRISTERRKNQLAVQDFNSTVRAFPRTVVASLHGFAPKPYFEANEAAQAGPPQVKF
jgi:LemA protein